MPWASASPAKGAMVRVNDRHAASSRHMVRLLWHPVGLYRPSSRRDTRVAWIDLARPVSLGYVRTPRTQGEPPGHDQCRPCLRGSPLTSRRAFLGTLTAGMLVASRIAEAQQTLASRPGWNRGIGESARQ